MLLWKKGETECDKDIRSRGIFKLIRGVTGDLDYYIDSNRGPHDVLNLGDFSFYV